MITKPEDFKVFKLEAFKLVTTPAQLAKLFVINGTDLFNVSHC